MSFRFPAAVLIATFLMGLGPLGFCQAVGRGPRQSPKPLPHHPGNIFLEGEEVRIPFPAGVGAGWTAYDFEGNRAASGQVINGMATLGRLPVGYYEVANWPTNSSRRVAVGVVSPPKAAPHPTSPIGLDVALGWFFKESEMAPVINLCTLAGVNWVRDRYTWKEMELSRGEFSKSNRYDTAVRAQQEAGLRVLQVNHYTPLWANTNQLRFPSDLRETYRLHREIAARWSNLVQAFEPWNEPDIDGFGRHTGSEIASFQKAASLGIKAGNPHAIACQAAFASHSQSVLGDFLDNQPWPYFDTFNLHHYIEPEAYPELYASFRKSCGGRPLWVTECNQPVHWSGDDKLEEPPPHELRVQAGRVAQFFATSLNQGASKIFYFTLTHYAEGQNQFGLLRRDLTPRPAYLAFAAVGRFLADASPLGRWTNAPPNLRAYLFRARPDGEPRTVMVAWSADGDLNIRLPATPQAIFDFLGRREPVPERSIVIGIAPKFLVLPESAPRKYRMEPPPRPSKPLTGDSSPIVFQALWPEDRVLPGSSAYQIEADRWNRIPVFAYNFSSNPVTGRLRSTAPPGWRVKAPDQMRIGPDERLELEVSVNPGAGRIPAVKPFRLEGDFQNLGTAVLSLPLRPAPGPSLSNEQFIPIPAGTDPSRWTSFVSGNGDSSISLSGHGVQFQARPITGNRWAYPRFELRNGERFGETIDAVQVKLTLLEGSGVFRVIFEEPNGAAYMADFDQQPKPGQTVETIALVERAGWGATWSMADSNGRLDLPEVKSIRIGCNTKGDSVKFAVQDLRWIQFRR